MLERCSLFFVVEVLVFNRASPFYMVGNKLKTDKISEFMRGLLQIIKLFSNNLLYPNQTMFLFYLSNILCGFS